jgi:hypothetical protein
VAFLSSSPFHDHTIPQNFAVVNNEIKKLSLFFLLTKANGCILSQSMKALRVDILKHNGTDCSNGGASHWHNEAYLVGDTVTGPWDVDEDGSFEVVNDQLPVFKLVHGNLHGTVKAICIDHDDTKKHCMFGGCFVYTSDSRFHQAIRAMIGGNNTGPVAIHDRYE